MTRVVLGNRHAIHSLDHGETFVKMDKGKRATVIDGLEDRSALDQLRAIIDPEQGIWALHATPGAKPAWVASDSPGLAQLLSEHFGGIEIRPLEDPTNPDGSIVHGMGLLATE